MKTYIGPATAQLQDGTTVNLKAPHQVTQSEIASAYAALRVERRMGTKVIKCFELSDGNSEAVIIKADDTWGPALEWVEDILESQFLKDKPWEDISVTVKCVYKTQQELDDLEDY